jgi:hypothetical protein
MLIRLFVLNRLHIMLAAVKFMFSHCECLTTPTVRHKSDCAKAFSIRHVQPLRYATFVIQHRTCIFAAEPRSVLRHSMRHSSNTYEQYRFRMPTGHSQASSQRQTIHKCPPSTEIASPVIRYPRNSMSLMPKTRLNASPHLSRAVSRVHRQMSN